MPNLSDLIGAGGNIKTVQLALSSAAGVNSQAWLGSNTYQKIGFNSVIDPYSLCTVNQAAGTFTLPAGYYGFEAYQGGFYAASWGGTFVATYRLVVGSTATDIWRQRFTNSGEQDGLQLGAPIFSVLPTSTTCSFEFGQTRNSGAPWVFSPLGTGSGGNTLNFVSEWFKLNIYKIR